MKPHPIPPLLVLVLVLALVVVRDPTARAQEYGSYEGREIVRIDFEVPQDVDVDRLRETLRTREGDLYRSSVIQKDIAALYGLGEFADVQVEAEPHEAGLRLIFRLRRLARVRAILFEGNVALAEKKLRALIQAKSGRPASPYLLKTDLLTIRDHYHDAGYLFAEVRQETRDVEDGVGVVYHIEAGTRLCVESVQFEGNKAVPDKDLRKAMLLTREAGLFGGRGKYEPALLRADLLEVRDVFRRKGYLDATVGHELIFDETMQRVYLVVHVREGPLYRVRQILLKGVETFEPSEVLTVMALREDEPFSQDQLDEDLLAISDLYGRKGFIKARIQTERLFVEDDPKVTLRLTVEEGPPCIVNKVMIRGNWRTKDHVIRRDVSLLPGERINTDKVKESKRRLTNTGLFFSSDPRHAFEAPVRISFLDTEFEDRSDVAVEVTEGGLGNVNVGAGWSSTVGLVGNLRLTLRNFDFPTGEHSLLSALAWTGGGETLTLSLSPGTDFQDYRLSWFNPSVWDSPYSTGFDAYIRDFAWSQYYRDGRKGLALTFGRRFFEDLRITLAPRIERVEISDLSDAAPADAFAVEGTHNRRVLTLTASYDKRDNIHLPTTGYRLTAFTEMGGTLLGGDGDFMREGMEARGWWTVWDQVGWGKHVVNFGGEIGLLQSTGSKDVPIFDRLFIGGLGSLRGFEYQRVGPVEPASGRQIGGKYQATLNTEYEAPLVKDAIRGVLFVDAGMLERSFSDLDFSRVRAAMGIGVRIRIPQMGMQQVPIGLYFSSPIQKESTDKTESVSFSIGTGFEF